MLSILGPGEPHFATPEHIKQAAIAAIYDNKTKYTAVPGTAELREAIIQRHRKNFRSNYSFEEVIACPGGKYALFMAMQVLIEENDEAIIPTPSWVSFKDMVRFARGKCVFANTIQNDFVLSPEIVERALTQRTKVIVLNFPNNPSGAFIDADSLERIVEIAFPEDLGGSRRMLALFDFRGKASLSQSGDVGCVECCDSRFTLQNLCHNWMAVGLRFGAGAGY